MMDSIVGLEDRSVHPSIHRHIFLSFKEHIIIYHLYVQYIDEIES